MQLAVRVIVYLLKRIGELPKSFKNWITVRIFRKHLNYLEFGRPLAKKEKYIAIFAIYPGTSPLDSVLRIIKNLKANNFQVLAVINNNKASKKYIDILSKNGCTVLARPNIGADFGAYQTGIRYLKIRNNYQHLEGLILVNDSIFVSKSSEKSISYIASNSNSTNCLFTHREGVLHAASMFLKFDRQILISPQFSKFWNRYFPYSSKHKVITLGEHKLTKIVGSKYFVPYVNLKSLNQKRKVRLLMPEKIQLLTWSLRTSELNYVFISESLRRSDHSSAISYAIFNLHLSNSLGLYLNRVQGVPLKLDLVKVGVVSPSDYLRVPRRDGCSPAEIAELTKIIEDKGSFATRSILLRISERQPISMLKPSSLNGKKHPFS